MSEQSPRVAKRVIGRLLLSSRTIPCFVAAIWAVIVTHGSLGDRVLMGVAAGVLCFLTPVLQAVLDRMRHGRPAKDVLFEGRARFLVEDVQYGPLSDGLPRAMQDQTTPSVMVGVLQVSDIGVRWLPGRAARARGAATFELPWANVESLSLGFGPFRGLGSAALELNVHREWLATFEVVSGPALFRALESLDQRIDERLRNEDAYFDELLASEPLTELNTPKTPIDANAHDAIGGNGFWHTARPLMTSEMARRWRWGLFIGWLAFILFFVDAGSGPAPAPDVLTEVVALVEVSGILITMALLAFAVPLGFIASIGVAAAGTVISLFDVSSDPSGACTELVVFGALLLVSLHARASNIRRRV
jgi:hypothetical protein